MELLKIQGLSFTYPNQTQKTLDDISFSVQSGQFIVVCGKTGCGKTTLLKLIKRELAPHGEKQGQILYNDTPIEELTDRTAACDIGYVLQNPDNQLITDKVWHELAFGLENMGLPTEIIRRRVGEMSCFFGIDSMFRSETASLSGGQKQLLNMASILVMSPKILILDEPTSQLDPIAAADFITMLQKINKDLGLTILLVEHRLEEVFPIADQVIVMDSGRILHFDTPRKVGEKLRQSGAGHDMLPGLPSAVRIFAGLNIQDDCPLTVREGRNFLSAHFSAAPQSVAPQSAAPYSAGKKQPPQKAALSMKHVWFRYEKDLPDILEDVSVQAYPGELFSILGSNGTGKTTLLKVLSAQERAYKGKIQIDGQAIERYKGNELYRHNLALLPQNPQTVFLKPTVTEDYQDICNVMGYSKEEAKYRIHQSLSLLGLLPFAARHPYDLSGGEQQKAALGKVLLLQPKVLLLDEPTKGIDAYFKRQLGEILNKLRADGLCAVLVTHDVEFAAEYSSRCAMLFDRSILSSDTPTAFFSGNQFYTTAANRIARHLFPSAITCRQVIDACTAAHKEASSQ
ncbi:MAG: ABC transporter ATP-binding protein [Christensenellales bacterium]